jgi:hypothetical protein
MTAKIVESRAKAQFLRGAKAPFVPEIMVV